MAMILIGLAGQSCAGKNEAGRILERLGWYVIDADAISRSIFALHEAEILNLFKGDANIYRSNLENADGSLNKKNLSSLLFSNPHLLAKMEDFVLPKIVAEIERIIAIKTEENPNIKIALNAPTLHKTKFLHSVSYIIYLKANPFVRFYRAIKRDGWHPINILKRFCAQRSFQFQYMARISDILLVVNNLSVEQLEKRIQIALKSVDFL